MAVVRDNIHYSMRSIQGYNKPFNFIMSAREPGKTTSAWMDLIYTPWKKNKRPWVYIVRQAVEITEALISSIFETQMNKFTDDNVEPEYTKMTFKDGVTDIKIKGELFVRIISLNIQMTRLKKLTVPRIAGILWEEYIIDPRSKEKYLPNEAFRFKELYTTLRREADGVLKVYFLANPYSLYNPMFVDWKVNTNLLKKDAFYVGDTFVIHWAILTPELRAYILKNNPLYEFDEDYAGYALEGKAKNDANIKIGKLPPNYQLDLVFKVEGKYVGCFKNMYFTDFEDDRYFCKFVNKDDISKRRDIYCFDFGELVERTCLLSMEDRNKFSYFKSAIRKRFISFSSIDVYYLIEEVYNNL